MYRLGVIPGDGIGPEVIEQALRVLEQASRHHGFQYRVHRYPWGADHFLETGQLLPDEDLEEIRNLDALLLGALGDPRLEKGFLDRGIRARMVGELDLYVNVRPLRLYSERLCPLKGVTPQNFDLVMVRETGEDLYAGLGGFLKKGTDQEVATAEAVFTRRGVERVTRYAFDLARSRPRHHLALVDKADQVPAHDLWRRCFAEVARDYPDVKTAAACVDVAVSWMIQNPEWFDVVVSTNVFGDLLMALGTQLLGGPGVASSAWLHPGQVSLFEPLHGPDPKRAGAGVASPLGAILAVQLMLDHLGEEEAATRIDRAVRAVVSGPALLGTGARTTREVGDLVLEAMDRPLESLEEVPTR